MDKVWMERWSKALVLVGFFLLASSVLALAWAVIAVITMWAWSLFMVPVFGLPLLSFAEAFGLVVLLAMARMVMVARPARSKGQVGRMRDG